MQSKLHFEEEYDPNLNLLPHDGTVYYFGKVLSESEASAYFEQLLRGVKWKNDESRIFGKHYVTKRKVAWYSDIPTTYSYSGVVRKSLAWNKALLELKAVVENVTGETFNSCLCNLYHNGEEGMGWHSDDEASLKENGAIASLSLGAERKFAFKHKQNGEKVEKWLSHGSLLLMGGTIQKHWLHRLPPTKKVDSPRINLTFRTMV